VIDRWIKKEGDQVNQGEGICEVTLQDLTIEVESPHNGIIADIIFPEGSSIAVHQPIAVLAFDRDAYNSYFESRRIEAHDAALLEERSDLIEDEAKRPDVKVLLREVRHLIKNGDVVEGSGKFRCTHSGAKQNVTSRYQ
jgi:pyruvate/2-oxoglutarate dehydrogenase complex dihydrolipoamide acyltransferase (E2) component